MYTNNPNVTLIGVGAGSLAYTGFESLPITIAGAILIVGGVILLRLAAIRRRREAEKRH